MATLATLGNRRQPQAVRHSVIRARAETRKGIFYVLICVILFALIGMLGVRPLVAGSAEQGPSLQQIDKAAASYQARIDAAIDG